MVPALFVIDDFLRNAEEVRRQALSLTYAVGGRYPGLNSVEKLRIEGLDQVNVELPAELETGPMLPVLLAVDGWLANRVELQVR